MILLTLSYDLPKSFYDFLWFSNDLHMILLGFQMESYDFVGPTEIRKKILSKNLINAKP